MVRPIDRSTPTHGSTPSGPKADPKLLKLSDKVTKTAEKILKTFH